MQNNWPAIVAEADFPFLLFLKNVMCSKYQLGILKKNRSLNS